MQSFAITFAQAKKILATFNMSVNGYMLCLTADIPNPRLETIDAFTMLKKMLCFQDK
jgi:hypothetical protein